MAEARISRRDDVLGRIIALAALAAAVAGWWAMARGMPSFVLPGPLDVAHALTALVTDPALAGHVAVSFARVGAAVTMAMLLALVLGLSARANVYAGDIIEHRILAFLNSFPSVGWAILAILWLQVSNATVIFIEVMIVLPFCLNNVLQGLKSIDPELEEMGQSLTRSRWRRLVKIELPLIAPFLAAGVRIAYGICWKIALVAELFGAQTGLGFLLARAQSTADAATVFACCILIVLIFLAMDRLLLSRLAQAYSSNPKGAA